jgi:replicative DNA helicase
MAMEELLPIFRDGLDEFEDLGISTGYSYLDNFTSGLEPGSVNIVASLPGQETPYSETLLTNMVRMHFEQQKTPPVYMSLNLKTGADITARFIGQGLNRPQHIAYASEHGELDQYTKRYMEQYDKVPAIIALKQDGEINGICKLIKRIHRKYGTRFFAIADMEYLYDVKMNSLYSSKELHVCMKKLKHTAKKLGVAIVIGGEIKDAVLDTFHKRAEMVDFKHYGIVKALVQNYYFVYRDFDRGVLQTTDGLKTEHLLEVQVLSHMMGKSTAYLVYHKESDQLEDKRAIR